MFCLFDATDIKKVANGKFFCTAKIHIYNNNVNFNSRKIIYFNNKAQNINFFCYICGAKQQNQLPDNANHRTIFKRQASGHPE